MEITHIQIAHTCRLEHHQMVFLIPTYSMISHICLSMFHCLRESRQEMAILQDMIPLLRPTKFLTTVMGCHLTPTDWRVLQLVQPIKMVGLQLLQT